MLLRSKGSHFAVRSSPRVTRRVHCPSIPAILRPGSGPAGADAAERQANAANPAAPTMLNLINTLPGECLYSGGAPVRLQPAGMTLSGLAHAQAGLGTSHPRHLR